MATTKTKERQGRGQLTERIKLKSFELMGYEITHTELRLMPYIQYCMVNDKHLDPNKVNGKERIFLASWRKRGFIEGGASGLAITKEFWDAITELIWLGYVDID